MLRRSWILVVLALLAGACSGEGAAATTDTAVVSTNGSVTIDHVSDDGSVTVTVEAGAPEVTIRELDPQEVGFPSDFVSFGAFELGPTGFDGGATVTIRTGAVWGPDRPHLPVGLVGDGVGEWEVIETSSVSSAGGEITVAFDVPHFSMLVVAASPWGIDLDPWFADAVVGERWQAHWETFDPEIARISNTRPYRTHALADTDAEVVGSVRSVVGDAGILASSRTGGAITADPASEVASGSYGLQLAPGLELGGASGSRLVEVLSGTGVFHCLSPGAGAYGFQIELSMERPDRAFSARYGDTISIASPGAAVVLRHAVAAPGQCREHGHTILNRIVQHFLEYDSTQTERVVVGMTDDEDPSTGLITPDVGSPARTRLQRVDLTGFGAFEFDEEDPLGIDLRYGSVLACGEALESEVLSGIEVFTICPGDPAAVEVGGMVLVAAEYADALPRRGTTEHYTYALALESDGDPADDSEPQATPDWDFYQGTDRWYQIHWDPAAAEWSMTASDGADPFGPSAARAVLAGNTIVWLVPASELPGVEPTYRLIGFAHDGDPVAEIIAGDVSGEDPTRPLVPIADLDG